jgi:hypothetical protein
MLGSVDGHAATATLQVSAFVAPRISAEVAEAPATVLVAADDVARGYLDAQAPLAIRLRSNLAHAFVLQMHSGHPAVSRIEALAAEGIARPTAGGLLVPPAAGQHQILVRVRFILDPSTPPGRYAWPVRLQGGA